MPAVPMTPSATGNRNRSYTSSIATGYRNPSGWDYEEFWTIHRSDRERGARKRYCPSENDRCFYCSPPLSLSAAASLWLYHLWLAASLSSQCTRQAPVFLRHRRFPAPALRFPAGAHVVVNRWPPGSIRTGRRRAAARVRRRSCTCVGEESLKLAPTAWCLESWRRPPPVAGRNARTRHRRTTVCIVHRIIPTYLAAKRSACAFSAAAKNSSISPAGGILALLQATAVVVAVVAKAVRRWRFGSSSVAGLRSPSLRLRSTSTGGRLDGVVSLLNYENYSRGNNNRENKSGKDVEFPGMQEERSLPLAAAPGWVADDDALDVAVLAWL